MKLLTDPTNPEPKPLTGMCDECRVSPVWEEGAFCYPCHRKLIVPLTQAEAKALKRENNRIEMAKLVWAKLSKTQQLASVCQEGVDYHPEPAIRLELQVPRCQATHTPRPVETPDARAKRFGFAGGHRYVDRWYAPDNHLTKNPSVLQSLIAKDKARRAK